MHKLVEMAPAVPSLSKERRLSSILVWAFGFAPLFLMLLTWSNNDKTWWIKTYALPVAATELVVVGAAYLDGMSIKPTRATIGLAALLMLAWITATLAPDTGKSIFMTELWTLHAFFGFAAARLFKPAEFIFAFLCGFIASMVGLAIFTFTAPPDVDWIGELPGLGNPRTFAIYAATAIGLGIALFADGKKWTVGIMAIGFTVAFWSGSRGPILATTAALLLSGWIAPSLRRWQVWTAFFASAATGFLVALLIGSPDRLVGVSRIAETTDNGRLHLWRATLDLISQRPLFGYGEGQTEHFLHIPWTMHPHNIVLQILLAWGVVGLGLVLGLGWWAIRAARRRLTNSTLPLVVACLVLLFYSLIDGTVYNVHSAALFAAFVGLILAAPDTRRKEVIDG